MLKSRKLVFIFIYICLNPIYINKTKKSLFNNDFLKKQYFIGLYIIYNTKKATKRRTKTQKRQHKKVTRNKT